jgi:hypothetical protein
MILNDMSLKPNSEQKHYFRLGVLIGMFVTIFVTWDLAGRLGEAVIYVYFAVIGVAGLLAIVSLLYQYFRSRRVGKPGPGNLSRR